MFGFSGGVEVEGEVEVGWRVHAERSWVLTKLMACSCSKLMRRKEGSVGSGWSVAVSRV